MFVSNDIIGLTLVKEDPSSHVQQVERMQTVCFIPKGGDDEIGSWTGWKNVTCRISGVHFTILI